MLVIGHIFWAGRVIKSCVNRACHSIQALQKRYSVCWQLQPEILEPRWSKIIYCERHKRSEPLFGVCQILLSVEPLFLGLGVRRGGG